MAAYSCMDAGMMDGIHILSWKCGPYGMNYPPMAYGRNDAIMGLFGL